MLVNKIIYLIKLTVINYIKTNENCGRLLTIISVILVKAVIYLTLVNCN